MSEVQTAAVVRVALTRDEKIAKLEKQVADAQAKIAELRDGARKEEALQNIGTGTVVSFQAGRAETRRTVSGTVLAAYDEGKVRKVKVLVGAGADAELFAVAVSQLDVPAEVEAEQDQLATTE